MIKIQTNGPSENLKLLGPSENQKLFWPSEYQKLLGPSENLKMPTIQTIGAEWKSKLQNVQPKIDVYLIKGENKSFSFNTTVNELTQTQESERIKESAKK